MKKLSILNVILITSLFLTIRFMPFLSVKLAIPEFFLISFHLSVLSLVLSLLMGPIIIRHLVRYRKLHHEYRFFLILGVILFFAVLTLTYRVKVTSPIIIEESLIEHGLGYIMLYMLTSTLLVHIEILIFKALTDRLSIAHVEGPTIIISALLFSAINVIAFMPFQFSLFPFYFLITLIIGIIIAYLYNQTTTLIIPEVSLLIATLIFNTLLCIFY